MVVDISLRSEQSSKVSCSGMAWREMCVGGQYISARKGLVTWAVSQNAVISCL